MVKRLLLLFFILLVGSVQAQPSSGAVSSTLTRDKIGIDEVTTLQITVDGVSNNIDVPTPTAQPDGLHFTPSGRQFAMTSVNGVTKSTTTFTFQIIPLEKGRFVIDPITIELNGLHHTTSPQRLEVTDSVNPTRSSQRTRHPMDPWGISSYPRRDRLYRPPPSLDDVLLEADLEPEVVYKHQPTIHTLRLLTAINLPHDPRYRPFHPTGLIALPMPQENSQDYRDGRGYAVLEAKTAFFPVTEGEYEFPAVQMEINARPFGASRQLTTKPLTLKVIPLPTEGRPDSFTGAVGSDFSLTARLDKTEVRAGQTVELRLYARGDGNLDLVPYPYLPEWSGIEKKQGQGVSNTRIDNAEVVSDRSYLFHLKTKRPGRYTLEGITLAYFDPYLEEYRTVEVPPLSLNVTPGDERSVEQTLPELTDELRPQQTPASRVAGGGRLSPGYFISSALLVALGLLLTLGGVRPTLWRRAQEQGYQEPTDLSELDSYLHWWVPETDRLSRQRALSDRGWTEDQITAFEELKSQLASQRFSPKKGRDDGSLLERFRKLRREVER